MTARFLFLATLLISTAVPAAAEQRPRCFSATEMNGWRSADGKSIVIRIGANRYYRLGLQRACSTLKSISPVLVLRSRGGTQICSVLDLDVKASAGGIVEPCFPKTLTELSAADVAALSKDERP